MNSRTSWFLALALVALGGCEEENTTPPSTDMAETCPSYKPTRCFGACTDVQTDPANCGKCDNRCAKGFVCQAGACVPDCVIPGQTACGDTCVDLQSDRNNCGTCGMACPDGEVCSGGKCGLSCQKGLTNCKNVCVNLDTDNANCGGCATVCPPGQVCSVGKCAVSCQANLTNCSGDCVNLQSDRANCGACGTACPNGQVCSGGKCALSCQMGLTNCNDVCVNLDMDNANCGACGTTCAPGEVCSLGKCGLSCQKGLTNCNSLCVNLDTDNANCGACGTTCAPGQVCSLGKCAVSCQAALTNCSGDCVNLKSDYANCGACAKACGAGQVCQNGACVATCAAPQIACQGVCVDPRFDPNHCGGCGMACAVANATPACSNGACVVAKCNQGFFDCDGDPKNGCEINLTNDSKHCGGCNKACVAGSACCNSGCIPVMQDNNNCGACGNVCAQGTACCGGACIDPKFQQINTLDCKKTIASVVTQGGGFQMNGMVDQLVADNNGISTIPANMNPLPSASPYIWIAAHDSHQVHQLDAKTGAVIRTMSSRGQNPSRGAVALDGSFWIANRGPNDPNNPNVSNLAQFLPDGSNGCFVTKAADGQPLPFCRALTIDANGYIWLGTWNDARLHKIDPATCKVIADFPMTATINGQSVSSYPYGLAVDRNGIMWNSNLGSGTSWLGMDVSDPDPKKNVFKYAVPIAGRTSYGVVIDRNNNVFYAQWGPCNSGVWRLDAANGYAVTEIKGNGGTLCTRGITLDVNGDIYAAEWGNNPACIDKFQGGSGVFMKRFCTNGLNNGVGVAGDTFGKIWETGYYSNNVARFDKDGNLDQGFPVALPGLTYYNYSDWNGMILKTVTSNNAQAGTWTWLIDAGINATNWATATWTSVTPPGTSVAVYFRVSNDSKNFTKPFCGPFYTQPVDLTACNLGQARYLQAQVYLNTTNVNVRPSMSNLKVYYQQ